MLFYGIYMFLKPLFKLSACLSNKCFGQFDILILYVINNFFQNHMCWFSCGFCNIVMLKILDICLDLIRVVSIVWMLYVLYNFFILYGLMYRLGGWATNISRDHVQVGWVGGTPRVLGEGGRINQQGLRKDGWIANSIYIVFLSRIYSPLLFFTKQGIL